jgi:hypothetical protein
MRYEDPNLLRVRAVHAPWYAGVEILITKGKHRCNLVPEEKETPKYVQIEPSARLTMEQAQTLMDDLWASGLRPTEGAGSAGSLRATEKHLEDMRKLVFESLGIHRDGNQSST